MKRTYVNRLPKNEEVKNTNVRIENGELIVEVEFKENFEPKDGDFCVSSLGNVFIYCDKELLSSDSYCGCYCVSYSVKGQIITYYTKLHTKKNGCRYATPEEKDDFLERLEKECGKRWNAEKKCLEDIRWRVNKLGYYFYVDTNTIDVRSTYDAGDVASELRYKNNNYFRTPEAAQKVADQIKEIFKNSKAE